MNTENKNVWLKEIPNKTKYQEDLVRFREGFGEHIITRHGGGDCYSLPQVFIL